MATNDFLVIAPGPTPNVASQAAYAADPIVTTGNLSGVAKSAIINKGMRQSSIMAAVLAQLIVDITGQNAVDDGTTSTLLANLKMVVTGRLINVRTFPGPSISITVPITVAYVPTAGTKAVRVRVLGGGGAGGGVPATTASQLAVGGPGGAGAYAESYLTSGFATGITITSGVGGFANTGVAGGNGGASSFGALVVANGGLGGSGGVASSTFPIASGPNTAATSTGGNIVNGTGGVGSGGFCVNGGGFGAVGANSAYGGGGSAVSVNGTGFGAGGSGFLNPSSGTARSGGYGSSGLVIVEEYA